MRRDKHDAFALLCVAVGLWMLLAWLDPLVRAGYREPPRPTMYRPEHWLLIECTQRGTCGYYWLDGPMIERYGAPAFKYIFPSDVQDARWVP